MISLHEIEPGVWVVPELVTAVTVDWTVGQWPVVIHMIGGEARVFTPIPADPVQVAAEIVAWIDERRIEPLRVVTNA